MAENMKYFKKSAAEYVYNRTVMHVKGGKSATVADIACQTNFVDELEEKEEENIFEENIF